MSNDIWNVIAQDMTHFGKTDNGSPAQSPQGDLIEIAREADMTPVLYGSRSSSNDEKTMNDGHYGSYENSERQVPHNGCTTNPLSARERKDIEYLTSDGFLKIMN